MADNLRTAYDLGYAAHKRGVQAAPALDAQFMRFLREATPANAPLGWSVPLMDEWHKGWHAANLMVPARDAEGVILRRSAESVIRTQREGRRIR